MELKHYTKDELHALPPREQSMQHYSAPEGYLDGLVDSIMAQISEAKEETPRRISLWTKLKPSLYLAASFIGVYLCFEAISTLAPSQADSPNDQVAQQPAQSTDLDEDSYARFYEEYAARIEQSAQEEELESDLYM